MKSKPAKSKSGPAGAVPRSNLRPPLTRGRLWLFRLTALALPILLLLGLELILRLTGYGYSTSFFQEIRDANGKAYLSDNSSFSLRFFPPQLARWPGTFKILAEKPANVRRVFIFGESAAMGDPQPAYGPSRCMEVLLRERFPNEKFEVINLGITAINSHVIRPIAQECAARGHGDVWIIYMGNNEMVGPFGAATVFGSRAPPLTAVRFNLAVQRTRVGQLAVAALRQLGGKSKNTSWGGMQMFLQNQIPPDDARRETVYRNFAGNLRDIVQDGLRSGAQVILSTVSVNLRDCPPFASMSNSNLPAADREQFSRAYAEALALERATNLMAAASQFEQAAKTDPRFAEAQFRWAECLARQSNAAAAREHFQLACDVDALPFRADMRINRTIRDLSQTLAVPNLRLCEAEAALAQAAPWGIAGDESFFEHVHFNFAGNYRLGRAWAEQVADALALPTNSAPAWATQSVCEDRLGLTDWNRLFVIQSVIRRLNAPPLSGQFNNAARLQSARTEEANLLGQNSQPGAAQRAGDLLNDAIRRAPEDINLYEGAANLLEATSHQTQAIAAYRELLKRLPHDFYASLQLGRMLGEQGQLVEAEVLLRQAAQRRPSLPEPWFELGVVLAGRSRFVEALECFERTTELRPRDGVYLAHKAKTLSRLNRKPEAIQIYREAIKTGRGGWEAHFELAGELAASGDNAGAVVEYTATLALNPGHATSHANLGAVFVRQNRLGEAIEQFEKALQLDPNHQAARDYLGQVKERKSPKP